MAEEKKKDCFWVDRLCGKHECFGYEETWSVKVKVDEKSVTLILPKWLPKIDVITVSVKDDLMFVIGKQREEWYDAGHLGTVVVAKRLNEKQFATVVWHETYPYALPKLGVIPEPKPKKMKSPKPKK